MMDERIQQVIAQLEAEELARANEAGAVSEDWVYRPAIELIERLARSLAQWEEWFQTCNVFEPTPGRDACAYCALPEAEHPRMISGRIYMLDAERVPETHRVEWLRGKAKMGIAVDPVELRRARIDGSVRLRIDPPQA